MIMANKQINSVWANGGRWSSCGSVKIGEANVTCDYLCGWLWSGGLIDSAFFFLQFSLSFCFDYLTLVFKIVKRRVLFSPSLRTSPTRSWINGFAVSAHVIAKAKGLAVLSVIKAGFLVTARGGSGIVLARLPNGSKWIFSFCASWDN